MSFEPIRRVLQRSVQSAPIAKELQIARVFEAWQNVIVAVWGSERAAFLTPVSFRDGTLAVETTSASAQQQLRVDDTRLKNEVNRYLSERVLLKISVRSRGY